MDVQQTTSPNEQQLAAARALIERAKQTDGRDPVSDQAMIAVAQGQRALSLFFDTARDQGSDPGAPVAVGIVGEGELDLVVDPEHRGRGVGTAALADLLSDTSSALKAWAHGENPAADALLSRAGFEPVRSLYLMQLDPELLPAPRDPLTVDLPEGYRLRTFDPGDPEDAAAWVRVNAAAFASHPEQGRMTVRDLAALQREPWFDADDLLLLEGPGGLAGSTWVKTVRDPEAGTETELYAIGVDPACSGKGLGKALLEATLARMAQHGPGKVTLYVDGDNERAVGMYEAAGFTVAARSRQWTKGGTYCSPGCTRIEG